MQWRWNLLSQLATAGAVIAAVLAPIALAFIVTSNEVTKAEFERTMSYAQDVMRRTEGTSAQVLGGIEQLEVSGMANNCSVRSVAALRNIDISSSYIQAIGRVVDNQLVCSSLGLGGPSLALGPVDIVLPNGVMLRTNVTFPFATQTRFLVAEVNGYAVIIHKSLPIDTALDRPDVSLASYSLVGGALLAARGTILPEWIARADDRQPSQFIADGYMVVVIPSQTYYIGAIAAVPVSHLNARLTDVMLVALPLGVLAGGLFAVALYRLAMRQRSMPNLIRTGLRHNEFRLEYQPVVDLRSGRWIGAEALIRWDRGADGVRPDIFIAAAEEAGLIQAISRRAIGLACVDAAGLFDEFPDFHLGINLSAADLGDPETLTLMDRLTEATAARSGNLMVEATERGFTDPEKAGPIIRRLRMSGIAVAVDDFGTGYSSLSTLEALELDYLKIDKSFVDTLGTGAATSSVVGHIIDMAKSLDLKMIAEGVETQEQADMLLALDVPYAQGWLFSRSLPMAQLIEALRRQRDGAGRNGARGPNQAGSS